MPVLRLFKTRVNEEQAARVLAKVSGAPIPAAAVDGAPKRFNDTLMPDHSGYEKFGNVFTYAECDRMLCAQEHVDTWEHMFNEVKRSFGEVGRPSTKVGQTHILSVRRTSSTCLSE